MCPDSPVLSALPFPPTCFPTMLSKKQPNVGEPLGRMVWREEEGPSPQLPGLPPLLSLGWQLALRPRAGTHCCYLLLGSQLVAQLPTALHCCQWTEWQVGGTPLWQQVGGGGKLSSSWQGQAAHSPPPVSLPLPQACAGGWTEHGQPGPRSLLGNLFLPV